MVVKLKVHVPKRNNHHQFDVLCHLIGKEFEFGVHTSADCSTKGYNNLMWFELQTPTPSLSNRKTRLLDDSCAFQSAAIDEP